MTTMNVPMTKQLAVTEQHGADVEPAAGESGVGMATMARWPNRMVTTASSTAVKPSVAMNQPKLAAPDFLRNGRTTNVLLGRGDGRHPGQHGHQGRQPRQLPHHQGEIGAHDPHHDQVTLGQVEHPGGVEDDGVADADQAVDGADGQTGHHCCPKERHLSCPRCSPVRPNQVGSARRHHAPDPVRQVGPRGTGQFDQPGGVHAHARDRLVGLDERRFQAGGLSDEPAPFLDGGLPCRPS